jgi:peptidoglycan hydrolase-like protein with peptidoglycan-binding domain
MNLEGRNLQVNMSGNDVRRLQTELRQLDFNLQVNGLFDSMTLVAVERFQRERGLPVNGVVDEVTARRINAEVDALNTPPLIVKGQVRRADGDPADGVLVSAFDVDLRNEQILGQTQTDRQGVYQIAYTTDQFHKREKGKADLVVKVLGTNNTVLVASPISFNAPAVTEIDLTIPAKVLRPLPLFDKIQRELAPLLENLRTEDLEENQEHQDLTFLSGETGFAKGTLARFVLAHKLVPQGIQAEFWFVLLGSSFYEYTAEQTLAEQLAAILEALPSLNAIAVRKALTRGFNEKEIAETFQVNFTEWIDAFLTLVARREVTATDKVTFVKEALEDARIQSTEKQIKLARLFNQYSALTPELLEELRQDSSFTPTEIADLDTSFQLADLTRGDFSVVKMLKQEFSVRQPEQIRTLAKRSENEWMNLVKAKHAAGGIKLPIEIGAIAQ